MTEPRYHRSLTRAEAEALVAAFPLLLDPKDVARATDVSIRTVRRWLRDGWLQAIRTAGKRGGRLRILKSSLVDLLVEMGAQS